MTATIYFCQRTRERIHLIDTERIAKGGEGEIFPVAGSDQLCAKILAPEKRTKNKIDKLQHMLTNKPFLGNSRSSHNPYAWPRDLLLENNFKVAGYLMPRIQGATLYAASHPVSRKEKLPNTHWKEAIALARNFAACVFGIHEAKYVVGDMQPSNFMVSTQPGKSSLITAVDTDSYLMNNNTCDVAMPTYAAPEVTVDGACFSECTDLFAMAVIIYSLLMGGVHPFDVSDLEMHQHLCFGIRFRNKKTYMNPRAGLHYPSQYSPELAVLPQELKTLFAAVFLGDRPEVRPTAKRWYEVLNSIHDHSDWQSCQSGNPLHQYVKNRPDESCPWCKMVKQGGSDLYPYSSPLQATVGKKVTSIIFDTLAKSSLYHKILKTGTIRWFHAGNSFGYIIPDEGGIDVRFHADPNDELHNSTLESGKKLNIQ